MENLGWGFLMKFHASFLVWPAVLFQCKPLEQPKCIFLTWAGAGSNCGIKFEGFIQKYRHATLEKLVEKSMQSRINCRKYSTNGKNSIKRSSTVAWCTLVYIRLAFFGIVAGSFFVCRREMALSEERQEAHIRKVCSVKITTSPYCTVRKWKLEILKPI